MSTISQEFRKDDLLTGLKTGKNYISAAVVAMVALALSIALAIASGGTPMMGLQAAIYGPFVQGCVGGSAYNILGPAGALVNVLSKISAPIEAGGYGPEIIPVTAIFGGCIGLTMFWMTGHRYFDEVEKQVAVLEGFSVGVAVVIGFGQFNNALGLTGQTDTRAKLQRHPEFYKNVGETFENIGHATAADYLPFIFFFFMLFFLNMIQPGKDATGKPKAKLPWLVITAAVGLVYGVVCNFWIKNASPMLIIDAYPTITQDSIFNFDYLSKMKDIPAGAIVIGSLKVAFVAIFETLISAMIAQYKWTTLNASNVGMPMEFIRWREILGLSIGNILSGVFGGTPCTGVLVRTGANIEYGAESRASQLINSVYVLIVTVLLLDVFAYLPLPVIAALLINSAYSLCKTSINICVDFAQKKQWLDVATVIVVAILCVFIDGAVGLLIGLTVRVVVKCFQGGFKADADEDYKKVQD